MTAHVCISTFQKKYFQDLLNFYVHEFETCFLFLCCIIGKPRTVAENKKDKKFDKFLIKLASEFRKQPITKIFLYQALVDDKRPSDLYQFAGLVAIALPEKFLANSVNNYSIHVR